MFIMESRHLLNLSVQNALDCISDNFNLKNFPGGACARNSPEKCAVRSPDGRYRAHIATVCYISRPPYHKILHPPLKDAICIKGTVKQAKTTSNVICNIGAKRIEQRFCAFYHPRVNFVRQQTGLLQIAKSCCREQKEVIHFATKSAHVVLPAQGKLVLQEVTN